jgi:hypothetical protein
LRRSLAAAFFLVSVIVWSVGSNLVAVAMLGQ